ncbi:hypothetical protein FACS1894113_0780 [Alphaproteobacteria bacterium]|nr:hypothetical protein FACS1894113_0780 [Alphaproteobacteria bacterium]
MTIKISDEAAKIINNCLANNPQKLPRILLKAGGCAGNILVLTLGFPAEDDVFEQVKNMKIAVSKDVVKFLDDVSIELKPGLGQEIIVVNNAAKYKCSCGKSFSNNCL